MSDKTTTDLGIDDAPMRGGRRARAGLALLHSEVGGIRGSWRVSTPSKVGRDETADIVVPDGKISRLHAVLTPNDDGLMVEDTGSHNGTFVDGVRVQAPTLAVFGATLRLGRTLLLVTDDAPAYSGFPPPETADEDLVGGPAVDGLRRQIAAFAPRREPVLISGESGSGKERVAQALHRASARAGELVSVNCAALPRELIESELFGYVSGAFSGARASRQGLFRTASGGTLFLDEVAEMPLEAQAKLLRVLEEGEVRAVGADRSVAVDVRVISATHQRLDALAVAGRFREDLFHRLAVLRIGVPPLRDRPDDALLLARRFLGDTDVTLSAGAAEALALAAWPGNVRELRNVIQRALVCVQDEGRKKIGRADLGRLARKSSRAEPKPRSAPADSEVLRARIETALKLRQGNVTQVAKDLEMHRGRLYEAFVRLAIDPEAFRDK